MIETLSIKNFRQIKDQTIELSPVVVVIGPNNGGKTSFLQAICLFATALQTWSAVVQQRTTNKTNRKTSVAIQLENLVNIPIAAYRELWTDLQLRSRTTTAEGKTATQAIKIEIHATGYTQQQYWRIGFEFDYGRDSLIYVRLAHNEQGEQYDFPPILTNEHIGYLPAMSGLNPWEDKLEKGSILRHIGNGKTADVLRNLCYLLYTHEDAKVWQQFTQQIEQLFQIQLQNPQYFPSSGLLKMTYHEGNKKDVDLSALGSGAKQTMLLFAYMWGFPNTVTLLDEPDAHLEVIRQKNIYDQISDIAKQNHTQLIIASHSESVLSTAFGKDTVISSVFGQLAKVNHKTHIQSVLRDFGYETFIIAQQRPYILYFEGSTDFDFLKAFGKLLGLTDFCQFLEEKVYPYPIGNDSALVKKHFASLRHFIPHIKGFAIFDNLRKHVQSNQEGLYMTQWERNEIENYIPIPTTLYHYIAATLPEQSLLFQNMLTNATPPAALHDLQHNFWRTTKISDDYLTPLFEQFFTQLQIPKSMMDKSKFYQLLNYATAEQINPEIINTLKTIQQQFME